MNQPYSVLPIALATAATAVIVCAGVVVSSQHFDSSAHASVFKRLRRWWFGGVSNIAQRNAANMLHWTEEDGPIDIAGLTTLTVEEVVDRDGLIEQEEVIRYGEVVIGDNAPRARQRYAPRVAALVKAEFGLLPHTGANVLVVQKFVRDAMRSHKVRPAHISYLMPIAVSLSFVPTRGDVMAKQLLATRAVADRIADASGNYWSGPFWARAKEYPLLAK